MENDRHMLVFGPAYLDIVVEIDQPLITDDPNLRIDQSVHAVQKTIRHDDLLLLEGPTGDCLRFHLPTDAGDEAATYTLIEPVLARILGDTTTRTVTGAYPISTFRTQLGGMGAGYAKAFDGVLRMPLGRDALGQRILQQLDEYHIQAMPQYLDDPTDCCLVILSSHGDKLAVGVRKAMVHWRAVPEDRALLANASALVFCGAPNALMAEVLSWNLDLPVMCAPALRNVRDTVCPLAQLAPQISYLTLNALEWEHLEGKAYCREHIPVITVTEGAHGSRIFLRQGDEITVPASEASGELNTNRAGETYASTFFKVLMHNAPAWYRTGQINASLAQYAGEIAAKQAARQLHITGFAFPPDDWMA